jgi:hypothetical protein
MYEQFTLNKTRIDLDVHEHFQDIRFQLDGAIKGENR